MRPRCSPPRSSISAPTRSPRPSAEALIDVSFIYSFQLGTLSPWSIYQGTGPVIVIERLDNQLHPHGGFSGVFGVEHQSGFFFEFKLSGGGGPNLRMGVGYTLRHKTP